MSDESPFGAASLQRFDAQSPDVEDVIAICVRALAMDGRSAEAMSADEQKRRDGDASVAATVLFQCQRMLIKACHQNPRRFREAWTTLDVDKIVCANDSSRQRLCTAIIAFNDISKRMLDELE